MVELGLENYAESFVENDVDFRALPHLDQEDLKELGVSLGHRKVILAEISKLHTAEPVAEAPKAAAPETSSTAAERRQLTVMFCDLVGSTELSGRLDPEDLQDVMRRYQDAMAGVVARYEGHVAKFLGDGVLAAFAGVQQAILVALVFRRSVELFFEHHPEGLGHSPLETRIAIAFGSVERVLTEFGSDVAGSVVDRCARIQGVAERGQILAEVAAYAPFKAELLATIAELKATDRPHVLGLKGIDEPVGLYELTTQDRDFLRPPSDRARYLALLLDALPDTHERAWMASHRLDSRRKQYIALLQNTLQQRVSDAGIDARMLHAGDHTESIRTAAELHERGIAVRVHRDRPDLSLTILDDRLVILTTGSGLDQSDYLPSESSFLIETLSAAYELEWTEAEPTPLHVARRVLRGPLGGLAGRSRFERSMQRWYGSLAGSFVDACYDSYLFASNLSVVLVVGKPGSGKSTASESLPTKREGGAGTGPPGHRWPARLHGILFVVTPSSHSVAAQSA